MKKNIIALILLAGLLPKTAAAHCPLCTAGAGALAVLAASLGVSSVVVGILIGAFALALSLWLAPGIKKWIDRVSKRDNTSYLRPILAVLIFLGTIIPIMPLVREYGPLYLSIAGDYGTILHNTYTINLFILGVVIGSVIMIAAPYLSKLVTKIRGKQIPYQGIAITLFTLTVASVIVQILS
ncbi:MAG: hypothetical protein A3G52_01195 [Candidatus Taylorbacteria bacterium RIFCSPLOWO2_12_FULL_43_20]|uniref:Cytochrome C biogenesis protein transmembrane domain-containing protein n=1 Tax=Candidatus Taylorbacteria bacterium RIFCSPLOWO2_12_FULL_43_20 TaxID=1802332 RepID=A0A1G2P3E1_9BACT|nr:MAG: hypothetical protein A2825_00590 [Candidatus Taylorbacteria bacterium RIFCSPHIGHO2_01_FULL_43_120]OHA22310.1 MAG: hypothetical protein A3B98_04315 [Candidatus Taylorbacteria bacterium RIFCSPHIGHO2_02_FULL_43_55]OHA30038.1 MAG: hypothetical protein A3E92_03280 [Candidatus Taylorbacteria bacterium RIFCSPHIGHO2_12_FULL_42_34]OHA30436.1 MAG: hypothetical protein A3B09_04340 [Candidatus Taylorbacteria bacterium RIFCSPLOWO2_01_FULL_43_83]OHA39518.1 MAG: hypothetical protein A3H58_02575 [Candi